MTIVTLTPTNAPHGGAVNAFAALDSLGRPVVLSEGVLERYDPKTKIWTVLATPTYDESWVYSMQAGDQVLQTIPFGGGSQGEIYDPVADTWSAIPDEPFDTFGRGDHVFWTDPSGAVYVVNGLPNPGDTTPPTTWIYSGGATGTWSTASFPPGPPGPIRNGFQSGQFQYLQGLTKGACFDSSGNVYIMGQAPVPTAVSAWKYTPSTDTWTDISAGAPGMQSRIATAVTPADVIYVAVAFSTRAEFWSYTVATDTWAALAIPPLEATGYILYNPGDQMIYGFGGVAPGATISQYDPVTDTWATITDMLSVNRWWPAVLYDGVGYYLIGGVNSGNAEYTTVDYWAPTGVRGPRSYAQIIG